MRTELLHEPATARLWHLLVQVEHALGESPVAHRDEGWGSRASRCPEAFAALSIAQAAVAGCGPPPVTDHLDELAPPRSLPQLLRDLESQTRGLREHPAPGWPDARLRILAAVTAVEAVLRSA